MEFSIREGREEPFFFQPHYIVTHPVFCLNPDLVHASRVTKAGIVQRELISVAFLSFFFLTRSALFVSKKSYMGKFYSLSKIFVSFSFLCSHVLHTCMYECFTYMHVCVYQMFSWYPQRAEESIKSSTS